MEHLAFVAVGMLLWVSHCKGEIRCHCNDASCVSTGYMCKSSLSGCFSQLTFGGSSSMDTEKTRNGCIESLTKQEIDLCEGQGKFIETTNEEWPILMCCKEDMCNSDMIDFRMVNRKSNGSSKDTVPNPPQDSAMRHPNYRHFEMSQKDLWFKAAVIAVPIAGGFILILLVLLAVRMLRNDSRRHRHLVQMRHRSLAKAQLYVADHFCRRESDKYTHQALMAGHTNPYSDVNIKIDHAKQGYERIRPTSDHSTQDGSVNSVVTWGNKPERATIV